MEWSIENILTAVGLIGAASAFGIGLWEYAKSTAVEACRVGCAGDESPVRDPMVQAVLQMVDWGTRRIRFTDSDTSVLITGDAVKAALRKHDGTPFTETEAQIRDSFDRLLAGLERLESHVAAGFVRK